MYACTSHVRDCTAWWNQTCTMNIALPHQCSRDRTFGLCYTGQLPLVQSTVITHNDKQEQTIASIKLQQRVAQRNKLASYVYRSDTKQTGVRTFMIWVDCGPFQEHPAEGEMVQEKCRLSIFQIFQHENSLMVKALDICEKLWPSGPFWSLDSFLRSSGRSGRCWWQGRILERKSRCQKTL